MSELPKEISKALKALPIFKKVVVGLSGGMDSVVLTHLLKDMGYEVIVAHLNHQLRGEASDKDEQFVATLAKKWGLPCISQKAVIPIEGNLEHNARTIRYAFLEEVRTAYKADFIAVGHHFDDQIETILMHEKRGSGLRGKRGMSQLKGKVIRPMLDIPRTLIESYAKEAGLAYVIDESNFDLNFARNHLRHKVIPELKKEPDFEEDIRRKAFDARQTLEALSAKKDGWLKDYFEDQRLSRQAFRELSEDLQAEILVHLLGQEDIYSKTLGRLRDFITHGKTGKTLLIKGMLFVIEYDRVRCAPASENQQDKTEVKGELTWGQYHIKVSHIKPLYARRWQAGDRFRPAGMKGRKKVQDFFTDAKVPRYERGQIPILVDENDDIICIGNLRFSEEHKHLKENIRVDEY